MSTRICVICGKEKELEQFASYKGTEYRRRHCYACKTRQYICKLKLDMFANLGEVCACCGEDHPTFLTLDHIKNDGHNYRDGYNNIQIYALARRKGWPKDEYQVLCMSCNFAKGHFEECPHKLGITAEMARQAMIENARLFGYKFRAESSTSFKPGFDVRRIRTNPTDPRAMFFGLKKEQVVELLQAELKRRGTPDANA